VLAVFMQAAAWLISAAAIMQFVAYFYIRDLIFMQLVA